jgi:hypothetical protein
MVSHNANIASLANIVIAPEQTVGAAINWSLPEALCIRADALALAASNNACPIDWIGAPTEPLVRFKAWHYNGRVSRPRGAREIIATQARHDDAAPHLVTFIYSVNLDGLGIEQGKLAPVGSVTFDRRTESFWWRFECGPMRSAEDLDAYIERAAFALAPSVQASDLTAFASHAIQSLADVSQFAQATCYSGDSLRLASRSLFSRLGGYLMSDRGGLWYLPRTDGGDDCPLTQAERLMRTIEEATDRAGMFYRLTMPRDVETTSLAANLVTEGLTARIGEIKAKVASLAEISRAGQHDTRIEELAQIKKSIAVYRDLLGIFDGDLLADAESVDAMMVEQIEAFDAGAPDREDAKKQKQRARYVAKREAEGKQPRQNASKTAKQMALPTDAPAKAPAPSLDAIEIAGIKAEIERLKIEETGEIAERSGSNFKIIIEADLAFGYICEIEAGDRSASCFGGSISDAIDGAIVQVTR